MKQPAIVLSPNPDDFQENVNLRCKIDKIASRISEAFDADGIDDIRVPKQVSFWWVILNIAAVGKLISDVIKLVKQDCNETTITVIAPTNDNQVSETSPKTNS